MGASVNGPHAQLFLLLPCHFCGTDVPCTADLALICCR